jgi:spore coat protein CotF
MNLAGKFLELQNNELAQEAMEGILGGGLAGVGMLGTDTPLPQVGIQTLGAMAGGVGLGMLGTRLGARLGKNIHLLMNNKSLSGPALPLKNQEGLLAMLGRTAGQKTLAQGGRELMRQGKGMVKKEIIEQTSARMAQEAISNPTVFAQKYGITAQEFQQQLPMIQKGTQVKAVLDTYETLDPKLKTQLKNQIANAINTNYAKVENVIAREAVENLDQNIARMAELQQGKTVPGTSIDMGRVFGSLLDDAKAVTGENVGRAIGRFVGDEIGVVAGLAGGGALSSAMGIENPKDKKIRELEQQLNYR